MAGLIGAPPSPGRPTALYLSGEGGDVVADALRTPEIRAEWLGPEPAAAASALKMSYAAWTKGLNALVLSIRALARAEGVDEALVAEWQRSQPVALAAVDRGSDRGEGMALGRRDARDRDEPRRGRAARRRVPLGGRAVPEARALQGHRRPAHRGTRWSTPWAPCRPSLPASSWRTVGPCTLGSHSSSRARRHGPIMRSTPTS